MIIEVWKDKGKYHALVKEYRGYKLIPVQQLKDCNSIDELFKKLTKEAKATFMIYESIHNTK
jgi:hypothetical protein